eukprot:TRINITY_DN2484_c0_g1_i1.p1 TRINITY_DN2484_c0_g1~~TRINITY_DN2484_c0_g1_i1.p1  ORF type:complete len:394 (+),score=76.62 TRINITY_DN2484_c0_g1_i1:60-1241(+)
MSPQAQFCFIAILLAYIAEHANVQAMNVTQLITSQGYPCETHKVETSDGFILTMIRIPFGKKSTNKSNRPVAFLQHGLLDSASTWVVNPPEQSLGFILADNGFDVFLGNVRGNTYSSENTKYAPDSITLWNLVDFDNMIAIDLPTMVNATLEITGASSLVYVGHSQGTLMGFGAFPLQPYLAEQIDLFVALAPVAYVSHVESFLLDLLADLDTAGWLAFFGEREFLPTNWIMEELAGSLCVDDPILCSSVIFLLCGYDPSDLNETRVHIYVAEAPAGTSVRNMYHWTQMVNSGLFEKFDYGVAGNIINYGQATPPQYRPQNMTVPLALFTGTKDILADPTDVEILVGSLNQEPVFNLNEPTYDHIDFVWAEDAYIKIYPQLVQLALKYATPIF